MKKRRWWTNAELKKLNADELGERILNSPYLQDDAPPAGMERLKDMLQCVAELSLRSIAGGKTLDQLAKGMDALTNRLGT